MEWKFLSLTLKAFGFSNKFTNLIHQCLSTVQYSVLLNGGKCPSFTPSRGLRQGDPLSPYLFILGSEVLMRLISREVDHGQLTAIKVSSNALPISKLCHADDVILFSKAKMSELASLKICLEKYCAWFGQKVNVEKFGIFPSKGLSQQFLNQIKACWGLNRLPPNSKYLGVPLLFTSSRCKDLQPMKERLENKLSGWKSKNLSWSGRATLIKSVAQTIPAYHMSTIQFPKALCEQLDGVIRRFWWNPKS